MQHIESKKYDLHDIYIDDGYSAKDTKRPALQRMLADMEKRLFDIVIFWRLDRLTRSVKDKSMIFEKFEKYNVDFKSMKEEYDTTTAAGRMVLNIMVSIAQGERETIGERVFMGEEHKALSGLRNGAIPPLGYDLVGGKLVPNDDADFVRRLFAMYQDNMSINKISKALNEEGRPMHVKTIHYILTNHQYCGKNRWNYRSKGRRTYKEIVNDGFHEPIISVEEFERVQKIIVKRKNRGKAATSAYPFTGVLKCARCGSVMTGGSRMQKKRKYKFYRCTGKVNYGSQCDMTAISEQAVVNAFLNSLDMSKKEWRQAIKLSEPKKTERTEFEKIERELQSIQKRKKRWQVAYANEGITLEELKMHTAEDRKREQFLKSELEKIDIEEQPVLSKRDIIDMLTQLKTYWYDIESDVAKKDFIHQVFSSITIDAKEKVIPRRADQTPLELNWTLR